MADRVTVETLAEMKRQKQRIVAAVVYESQMAQIMDRAGADVLSVGDSLSRNFLGHEGGEGDDLTVDEMIPFCRAVCRAAKRAFVSCDMPGLAVDAGPKATVEAARRFADVGAQAVKVDIREDMDKLFPCVAEVINSGVVPVYPQIGFTDFRQRFGGEDVAKLIAAKAKQLEEVGAVMLDLTAVAEDIYVAASKAVKIPVIGGQAGPDADGRIYVSYGLVGYGAAQIDSDRPTAAKFIYELGKKAFDNVRAGTFKA